MPTICAVVSIDITAMVYDEGGTPDRRSSNPAQRQGTRCRDCCGGQGREGQGRSQTAKEASNGEA